MKNVFYTFAFLVLVSVIMKHCNNSRLQVGPGGQVFYNGKPVATVDYTPTQNPIHEPEILPTNPPLSSCNGLSAFVLAFFDGPIYDAEGNETTYRAIYGEEWGREIESAVLQAKSIYQPGFIR